MASGVWGRFDEAQKAHEALFSCFSMKDLHGVVGVLVFLSFLLLSFQYLQGHLDPDAGIDSVLVIYIQIYPPYFGGHLCWAPMYAMGFCLLFLSIFFLVSY